MKEYTMKYGKGDVKFSLDPALVLDELVINEFPELADPAAAIREAIRNPIGSPALRDIVKPGQTVAFIVNDPTRIARSYVFLPVLMEELNEAGIPDENMRIVFALGTHRAMTEEEMIAEVGAVVAKRVKMYNPDCKDESTLQYFGTTSRGTKVGFSKLVTEVDHIICTGGIVHHFFSGYGGGRNGMGWIFPLTPAGEYERLGANAAHREDDVASAARTP